MFALTSLGNKLPLLLHCSLLSLIISKAKVSDKFRKQLIFWCILFCAPLHSPQNLVNMEVYSPPKDWETPPEEFEKNNLKFSGHHDFTQCNAVCKVCI